VKAFWTRSGVDMALLGVAIVWGSSYLAAKELTEAASVPAVLAIRFAIASAALGGLWLWRVRRLPGRAELATGVLLASSQPPSSRWWAWRCWSPRRGSVRPTLATC
jgi:drug/metabolite transporter (DMT)-like permease